jgi:thiol-disulfide isomerase/thioredoxin
MRLRRLSFAALALLVAFVTGPAFAATQAPEFAGVANWINSKPLTMKALRGKVVLIDFWAYSCINCLRTLPQVTRWYDTYKDKGLVVVGVHSPEFEFEKQTANVQDAVKRFKINYPVAQDNDSATWDAWSNRFWPAEYLVDQQGNVVAHHYGEGNYLEMENNIRGLLGLEPLQQTTVDKASAGVSKVGSPEMYFGGDRVEFNASPEAGGIGMRDFSAPSQLALNHFALVGLWEVGRQNVSLARHGGEIRLHFKAGKVHMVASALNPVALEILVDGKPQPAVTVQASKLYTLFDSNDYREHVLTIRIPKAGFHAFTFTFG